MRTSKIAQETSRLANAMSGARGAINTRRSLRVQASTTSLEEEGHGSDGTDQLLQSSARKRKRKSGAINGTTTTRAPPIKADTDAEVAKSGRARKARRQPAKKVVGSNGDIKIEPPLNWEEMYTLTQEMRSKVVAPVDHQGCESLAQKDVTPRDQRFQTLIALMLSSQTKDPVTAAAIKNLQDNLPGGLNLESILAVEPTTLNHLIGKVGFHNLKTKYIKSTALILRDQHNSDIPDTIAGMIALPGVGPKMAYLCMSAAWGRDEGIGVDVHVHRITNLWGWHKTNQPEETRAALEAWLPKEKWHEINHLLVGFGQMICLPVGRKCGECTLSDRGLCPGAVVAKKMKTKAAVKKEVVPKVEEGREAIAGTGMDVKIGTEEEIEEVIIKAEEVERTTGETPDIEDIGLPSRDLSSGRKSR